ncbi:MAG TPA: metallophosphoesterase [Clostridia bacterium]|nr:metallophosphoesterase [Clostridia bacterium]
MKKYRLLSLLLLNLLLLLSFGCVKTFRYTIGCAEIKSDEKFTFFVASDLHYLSGESFDNGKAFNEFLASGDGKLVQYSGELLDALIRDIKREQPDFLIITGDLTCNGERKSHLELVGKLETVEKDGTCVFVVPGNHDVQNPWAKQYIGDEAANANWISSDEYLNIYGHFGYDDAVSKDTDSLSYLAMPAENTWLLMLDSSDSEENMGKQYPEQGGVLTSQTLEWVEQCAGLATENKARLIAVMHHSLLDHSKIMNKNYTLNNNEEALKVFRRCGIEVVLTGHIHIQDIKTDLQDGNTIYDIGTSSLAVYPHQYGKMEFTPEQGFDYSTIMVDVGKWSRQTQVSDEFLLDFEACSMDFFKEQCCKMHQRCLTALDKLSEEEMNVVLETVDKMNVMYFAGYRNEALNGIVNTEGFRALEEIPQCFTKDYAMSMLNDERADNNILHIPLHYNEGQASEE